MPKRLALDLSAAQRAELIGHRDHDRLPYLRERCAALLKIADGWIASEVARIGLHRRYDPDAIYEWRRRYLAVGIAGLKMQAGRGRKPAFSPCGPRRSTGTRRRRSRGASQPAPLWLGPGHLDACDGPRRDRLDGSAEPARR